MDASLLLQLLGAGQGEDVSFGAPPSGLPPIPSLSGAFQLRPGADSMSGTGGIGGTMSGGTQGLSGMPGGPSLFDLQQFFGPGTEGAANLADLTSGIGGTLAQQQISQGQGTGGYSVAGGATTGGATRGYAQTGQTAGADVDPLAIAAKLLGVAKGAVGGFASPTQGDAASLGLTEADIAGSTPEVRAAFEQQRAGERTASPYVLPPLTFDGGNVTIQPPPSLPGYSSEDILRENLPPGGEEGFANIAGPGAPIGTGTSQAASGSLLDNTNVPGALRGGLTGAIGLLNILQAAQNGSVAQGVGGGLQGVGGLTQLLGSSPELAKMLGLTPGMLGATGAVAGGLGGLLGLAGGVQGLVNGAPAGQTAMQLGSGALGTYAALSTLFPSVFPSISSLAGSALSGLGLGAIGGAGGGLAGGAAGMGAGVGSAAGSLTGGFSALPAGVTGGIVALPLLAAVAMNALDQFATGDNQKAAAMQLKRLASQIPGAMDELRQGATSSYTLDPNMPLEQKQALLQSLDHTIFDTLKGTGLYGFLEHGGTSVRGNSMGLPGNATFDQGPQILQSMSPAMQQIQVGRIKLLDQLANAGISNFANWGLPAPDEAYRLGSGSWYDPITLAQGMGGPEFQKALMPWGATNATPEGAYLIEQGLYGAPGSQAIGLASNLPTSERYKVAYQQTPYGLVSKPLYDQLMALKPGNLETGLMQILSAYGPVGAPYAQQFAAPTGPLPAPVYQPNIPAAPPTPSYEDMIEAQRYQDFTSGGM